MVYLLRIANYIILYLLYYILVHCIILYYIFSENIGAFPVLYH